MIVVDVGNTNIVVGIYDNKKLKKIFRYETKNKKVVKLINSQFTKKYIKNMKIKEKICIYSSVFPAINNKIKNISFALTLTTAFQI